MERDERIIGLFSELNDVLADERRIYEEIEKIRNSCDHKFEITKRVGEDILYECEICGKEIWK